MSQQELEKHRPGALALSGDALLLTVSVRLGRYPFRSRCAPASSCLPAQETPANLSERNRDAGLHFSPQQNSRKNGNAPQTKKAAGPTTTDCLASPRGFEPLYQG